MKASIILGLKIAKRLTYARLIALDAITDAVLAYNPKPKTKAAKRRIRKQKRKAKAQNG